MKSFIRYLSVVLCTIIIISSFSTLSFAEEKSAQTETTVTETTDSEISSDSEEAPEATDPEVITPVEPQKEQKKSYGDFVGKYFGIGLYLLDGAVKAPLTAATLCLAFVPMAPFIPIIAAVAAVGGVGASVAGVFLIAFSPIIGLVTYLSQ